MDMMVGKNTSLTGAASEWIMIVLNCDRNES